jgi:hypothetical protein
MGSVMDEIAATVREAKARMLPLPIGVRVSRDFIEAVAGQVPERPDGYAVGRLFGLDVWVDPRLAPEEWHPVYRFDPMIEAFREILVEGLKGGR